MAVSGLIGSLGNTNVVQGVFLEATQTAKQRNNKKSEKNLEKYSFSKSISNEFPMLP